MGRPVGAGRPARRLYRGCPFNPYIVGRGTLPPCGGLRAGRPTYCPAGRRGRRPLTTYSITQKGTCPHGQVPFYIVLSLTFPEVAAVRLQRAAAAKVVVGACDEVHRVAAARVKVGVKRIAVRVDGHQHPLTVGVALKNQLLRLDQHIAVAAPA